MKTTTTRSKPQRFVKVAHREAHGILMQLTVKTPRTVKESLYIVQPIPGCTLGQGYYFARPQPAEAVEDLLERGPV